MKFGIACLILIVVLTIGYWYITSANPPEEVSAPIDTAPVEKVENKETGREIVEIFFSSYKDGDENGMNDMAAEGAKYDDLVSSGLPKRIMQFYPTDWVKEYKDKTPEWFDDNFTVSANDTDGKSWNFLVTLDGDKISKIIVDPNHKKPGIKPGWVPLTSQDRLALIKASIRDEYRQDVCYWDFESDASYKGYVRVVVYTPAQYPFTYYFKKTDGEWTYVIDSMDYIPSKNLSKLSIPLDVQKAVWGASPEKDKQKGIK